MNKFQIADIKRTAQSVSVILKRIDATQKKIQSLNLNINTQMLNIEKAKTLINEYQKAAEELQQEIDLMREDINSKELYNIKKYGKPSTELCTLNDKGHWQFNNESVEYSLDFNEKVSESSSDEGKFIESTDVPMDDQDEESKDILKSFFNDSNS